MWLNNYETVAMFILYIGTMGVLVNSLTIDPNFRQAVPPTPKHQGTFEESHQRQAIANRIKSWTDQEKQNVWELSGLYEGDIMIGENENELKTGLVDKRFRWRGGIVPYRINKEYFAQKDIDVIESAIREYHEKTCIRFRPYKDTDKDYITIEGKMSGCWSFVGRLDRGQVVNIQNPGCVYHGTVVHELLHALGFHHQQSATDRDDWVTINWQNIESGKEHNFNKYNSGTITDFGIGYDYMSVMHYGSHAFSKNSDPTITPKKEHIEIGQRKGLSRKDVLKLQAMYKQECLSQYRKESMIDDDFSNDVSID